jgi:hypothetical protein
VALPDRIEEDEILHVIVGHGLPTLFLNTVRSFRAVCPASALLVIDNDSPQQALKDALQERAAREPRTTLVLRGANERVNGKVGGLYAAYRLAFDMAAGDGYRYVHLIQGDMQCMWWDGDARAKLAELYRRHPNCVNVHTRAFSSDRALMDDLMTDPRTGDTTIPKYGMTDTGMVDLRRWNRYGMQFLDSEEATASLAAEKGLEAVVSPWPTEVAVPWPAVVRAGRQVGREVKTAKPLLCRPLGDDDIATIKAADRPVAVEEICVPWGWSCLAPMSETDLSKWYYLNYRRRALQRYGWKAGRPTWVVGGLDRRRDLVLAPHRPSLTQLFLRPLPSLIQELARHLPSPCQAGRAPARHGKVPSGRGVMPTGQP